MTPDEALSIVDAKAAGRTRFAGMEPYVDEVLAAEVRRLRNELAARTALVSREDYERWVRAYSQGDFASCQKP